MQHGFIFASSQPLGNFLAQIHLFHTINIVITIVFGKQGFPYNYCLFFHSFFRFFSFMIIMGTVGIDK